jgi:hypothetical protein
MKFKGKLTKVQNERVGTSAKGEWASLDFELTESEPHNPDYPQIALFSFFKNGEYINDVKEFKTKNKIGDVLEVDYNFKKSEYTKKDGTPAAFYGVTAWKVENLGGGVVETVTEDEENQLPF